MAYQGPYSRYVQYTKGYTNINKNDFQRGTVEYTRFGSEYFSGANVGVYFGDVLVDQIFNLQFNLQEQVIPIYGYGSYTYDAVAKGQRIINGSFNIYFREAAYLKLILDQIELELGGTQKSNPFKYDTVPEETTIENILEELSSKTTPDFDKLATSYEEAIWGNASKDNATDGSSKPYFIPINYNDTPKISSRGFDILISYGPEAKRQRKNLGELSPNTTVQAINGVHITSVSMIVDATGQPLYEQYSFMARDLNSNIHNGVTVKENSSTITNPTLKTGHQGAAVKELQVALNKFITYVIDLEADSGQTTFKNMLKKDKYLKDLKISVDSDYGPQTKRAVEVFQEYYDLSVNGIVNKSTWEKLRSKDFI